MITFPSRARAVLIAAAIAVVAATWAALASGEDAARAPAPGHDVQLRQIGSFDQPVYLTGAPGYPRLLFVVEQPGRIRVIRRGRTLRRPFLDITGRVQAGGEEGLLSVAFPPDYRRSKRFYVFYTDGRGDLRVDEFRRRTAVRAARGSGRQVIRVRHPRNANHNGGQLQFLGGLLYISTGDGGAGGDPPDNAKNRNRLLGKILRIDPTNPPGPRRYRIPRNNPFVGRPGRNQIFAYGLRNPFRFSFFHRKNHGTRIIIGDVGQDRFEEVNYETLRGARGAHFGWDEFEGFAPYECDARCARRTTKPIHAYGGAGCSVIGGYVVQDPSLGSLRGRYLFADLCEGEIRSLRGRLRGRVRSAPETGMQVSSPSSFGVDTRGRVFVVSLNGPVYRLVPR